MKSCNNCQKSVDGCPKRKSISHDMIKGGLLGFQGFRSLQSLEEFWKGVGSFCSEHQELKPLDFGQKKEHLLQGTQNRD